MCYRVEVKSDIKKIATRFNATVENPGAIIFDDEINGFAFPALSIITNEQPNIISTSYSWGLIPHWADDSIRKNTLNAKIETLHQKPAFRDSIAQRCLIIVTGYYEWRWNDVKGKSKQKFKINSADDEIFSLAGIYSDWFDQHSQQPVRTFSMVTTEANEKMQYVHNMKKRMPVMLQPQDEVHWLDKNIAVSEFAFPKYNANLIAFNP